MAAKSTREHRIAPVGKFTLLLRGVGNPDYGQYADVANPEAVVVDTLGEACERARAFIERWNLGGGNWPPTHVYDSRGSAIATLTYNGKAYPPGPWTPGRTPLADDVRPFDTQGFPVPGLKVRVAEIVIERLEGPIARVTPGGARCTSLAAAQGCIANIAMTAPKGGGYDKTDCTIRFVDGAEFTLRIDVDGDDSRFFSYDLGKHLRRFLGFRAGKLCPPNMTPAQYQKYLTEFVVDPVGFTLAFDAYIAKCGCERGSTCDISHDPATCPCTQCVTATKGA